jgi:hypothetical protein
VRRTLTVETRTVEVCNKCRLLVEHRIHRHGLCELLPDRQVIQVEQHAHDWSGHTTPGDALCAKCGAWTCGYGAPPRWGCIDIRPMVVGKEGSDESQVGRSRSEI